MGKFTVRMAIACGAGAMLAVVIVFGVEMLVALPGPDDHYTPPSRDPVHLGGVGKPIVYVVMGDSTAAGRGGDYTKGIAMETASHLARYGPVTLVNLAVSGAKVADVLHSQLSPAVALKPNIVLLAVGANDATHFTSDGRIETGLDTILAGLGSVRPAPVVVLTGSPDLGGARRFAQPLRWFAGTQTNRVNAIVKRVARRYHALFAPIADITGPEFRRDPTLLAPDRFHPNNRGYATWFPVLNPLLDQARGRAISEVRGKALDRRVDTTSTLF